jgi:nuclear GTP-binding protein
MVKFTNHAKGRPSKRKTLKTRYKIERKVKQHNKRVRKEARKLTGKGLKHKSTGQGDFLPNMFPFKQQLLD